MLGGVGGHCARLSPRSPPARRAPRGRPGRSARGRVRGGGRERGASVGCRSGGHEGETRAEERGASVCPRLPSAARSGLAAPRPLTSAARQVRRRERSDTCGMKGGRAGGGGGGLRRRGAGAGRRGAGARGEVTGAGGEERAGPPPSPEGKAWLSRQVEDAGGTSRALCGREARLRPVQGAEAAPPAAFSKGACAGARGRHLPSKEEGVTPRGPGSLDGFDSVRARAQSPQRPAPGAPSCALLSLAHDPGQERGPRQSQKGGVASPFAGGGREAPGGVRLGVK